MVTGVGALVALLGGVLGFWALMRMMSITGPLLDMQATQRITFDTPGAYVLYAQPMKFLKSDANRASIGVWDASANAYLVWNRTLRQRRDLGATRVSIMVFHVPRAGEYQLVIGGVDFLKAPFEEHLIFGRYVADKTILWVFLTVGGVLACLIAVMIFMVAAKPH